MARSDTKSFLMKKGVKLYHFTAEDCGIVHIADDPEKPRYVYRTIYRMYETGIVSDVDAGYLHYLTQLPQFSIDEERDKLGMLVLADFGYKKPV